MIVKVVMEVLGYNKVGSGFRLEGPQSVGASSRD